MGRYFHPLILHILILVHLEVSCAKKLYLIGILFEYDQASWAWMTLHKVFVVYYSFKRVFV